MVPAWMQIGVAALVLVILQACIGTGGLDSPTPTCRHLRGRAGALRFARDALRLRGAGVAGIESSEDDLQLFLAHRRSVCHAHPQSRALSLPKPYRESFVVSELRV